MRRGLGFHARRSPGVFNPASLFLGGTVQGAWYDPSDSTTLFSDRAGTTPCGTPGGGSVVPVGLMLDKSQNGVGTNGAKRVNLLTYSEQFDNAYWTKFGSSITATNITDPLGGATADALTENSSSSPHRVNPPQLTVVAGAQYTLSAYVKANGRNFVRFNFGGWSASGQYAGATFDLSTGAVTASGAVGSATLTTVSAGTSLGNGWWRFSITATIPVTDGYAVIGAASTGTPTLDTFGDATYAGDGTSGIYIWGADLRLTSEAATLPLYQRIDANWYSTMAGNHAIAANDTTARPELRARVNLLLRSQEFTDVTWTATALTPTSAPSVADPSGGAATFLMTEDTSNNYHRIYQVITTSTGVAQTFSIYLKDNGARYFNLATYAGASSYAGAIFDLTTLTATVAASGAGYAASAGSVTSVGNGWYRCQFTATVNDASQTINLGLSNTTVIGSFGLPAVYVGTSRSLYATFVQLTATNEFPANTYQRISDANTYDAVGFPRYLAFNGTSSAMSTPGNVNLSGTDKATVFAGVRKLSDGAQGVVAELSATIASNNGTFLLAAPNSAAANYNFSSKGTTQVNNTVTTFTAPITNVLTGQADIAAPSNVIQVNGAPTTVTSTQGTGNFGSYPLFIGARNNSSLFLNGNLYSLIVVGSAVSAGQISATEQWVAAKTGITI